MFFAVGQKIKELRKQIGLSQEELATGICTQAQISKIEKGRCLSICIHSLFNFPTFRR
ncbi:helix-turn-helix transcriptional regulator [Peribacillus frigoritolerans]|nr:helix-turn-helix transcriptional regulator [Peribacillus frigoritolerans]